MTSSNYLHAHANYLLHLLSRVMQPMVRLWTLYECVIKARVEPAIISGCGRLCKGEGGYSPNKQSSHSIFGKWFAWNSIFCQLSANSNMMVVAPDDVYDGKTLKSLDKLKSSDECQVFGRRKHIIISPK